MAWPALAAVGGAIAKAVPAIAKFAGGALGSAFGGIGTGLLSGNMSNNAAENSAHDSFMYSVALQNLQNAWSEKMAKNSHQYEVEDLRKAGLNPILSANSGASFPSSGSATISENSVPYDLVASAKAFNDMKNNNKSTKSQVELNESQQNVNDATVDNIYEMLGLNKAQINANIANSTAKTQAEISYINGQLANILEQTNLLKYNAETNRINANASMLGSQASSSMSKYYNSRLPYQNKYDAFSAENMYWNAINSARNYNISGANNPNLLNRFFLLNKYYRPVSISH